MTSNPEPGIRPNLDLLRAELARARLGLQDLEAEYAELADPDAVALDDEHDSEGATVGFERARVAGLIDRSKGRLADLEIAAQRAEEGTYGYCRTCGDDIGSERLGVLPATQFCIRCAR